MASGVQFTLTGTGEFEGMSLLLGVAYVQPEQGNRGGVRVGRENGGVATGGAASSEWRMYSRLRVDGNRFEEPTPICVALCSLSGKRWARKVAAIWTSRIEQGGGAGGGRPFRLKWKVSEAGERTIMEGLLLCLW
jgi:hypothetical protein